MLFATGIIINKLYREISVVIHKLHGEISVVIHESPLTTRNRRVQIIDFLNSQIRTVSRNFYSEISVIINHFNSALQRFPFAFAVSTNFSASQVGFRFAFLRVCPWLRTAIIVPVVPANNGNVVLAVLTEQTSVLTPFGNSAVFRLYHLFLAFVLCENHTRQNYKYQQ